MRVTVIGTGYVGTVTGACLAYLGHKVTCVDTDVAKIEKLRQGQAPIYEPGLEELIVLAQAQGGIDFQTSVADPVRESDVIFNRCRYAAASFGRVESGLPRSRRAQHRGRNG